MSSTRDLGWIHCYKERPSMDCNYSPSADAFEDTVQELRETKQLKRGDNITDSVYLEWYFRLFEVKTAFNGLDLIGTIYDDQPEGYGIRWRDAYKTTCYIGSRNTKDHDIRNYMDIYAKQTP